MDFSSVCFNSWPGENDLDPNFKQFKSTFNVCVIQTAWACQWHQQDQFIEMVLIFEFVNFDVDLLVGIAVEQCVPTFDVAKLPRQPLNDLVTRWVS